MNEQDLAEITTRNARLLLVGNLMGPYAYDVEVTIRQDVPSLLAEVRRLQREALERDERDFNKAMEARWRQ